MTPANGREEDFMTRLTIKHLATLTAVLLLSVLAIGEVVIRFAENHKKH